MRIALANLRFPATPDESVTLAEQAIHQASLSGARIICFPECFVPGYRIGKSVPPPDAGFLERAWSRIAAAAAKGNVTVVLGTLESSGSSRNESSPRCGARIAILASSN